MQGQYTQRRRGSVRFDPYYKVQWYDAAVMAWRDVQTRHDTLAEAIAAFPRGRTCRVMEVTMHGRHPVPPS